MSVLFHHFILSRVLVSGLSNMMGAAFTEMEHLNQQNDTSEMVDKFTNETELQDKALKVTYCGVGVGGGMLGCVWESSQRE